MPIESAVYLDTLQPDWPQGLDPESAGDDHLRLVKQVLKNTFPNITGPVTGTYNGINDLTTHIKYEAATADNGNFARVVVVNDDYSSTIGLRAASFSGATFTEHSDLVVSWGAVMSLIFPVGHVIINTGQDPAQYLGFGTWTQRPGAIYGYGTIYDVNGIQQNLARGETAGYLKVTSDNITPFQVEVSGDTDTDGAHGHTQPTTEPSEGHFIADTLAQSRDEYSYPGSVTISPSGSAHPHHFSTEATIGTGAANMLLPGWTFSVWERTA